MFPLRSSAATGTVLISGLKTAGSTAAHEYVELYNASGMSVDLAGWKVQYQSAAPSTPTSWTTKLTLTESFQLPAYSFMVFATEEYTATLSQPSMIAASFSSAFSNTGGHVRITDEMGQEVDRVGWGNALYPEGVAVDAPSGNEITKRCIDTAGAFVDTDNNFDDFRVTNDLVFQHGPPCTPREVDVCPNLLGEQVEVPEGYELVSGECLEVIVTPSCQGVSINEIVPNPSGSDTGKEFIELYNATDQPVVISECFIKIDTDVMQLEGSVNPGYMVLFGYTLPNSAGASVTFITNTEEYEVVYPPDMDDDESWSLIDGVWQISSVATPGAENLPSPQAGGKGAVVSGLKPCRPDQFRNPETNRCKKRDIATTLKPCGPGQYRNLETNRCRNIASSSATLTPCRSDQYRNPETNRCRKLSSASTNRVPCREGYERNSETNRCRKVAAAVTSNPLTQAASIASKPVRFEVMALVGAGVLGYGLFEYRQELRRFFMRKKQLS